MGQTEATARWQTKSGLATRSYKLKNDVADRFAATCAERGESQASVITAAMLRYIGEKPPKKPAMTARAQGCSTRRQRRPALERVRKELEWLRDGEDNLANSAPSGLENAPVYQQAAEYVAALDDVIELLNTLYE